ncbi:MAG: aminoacyl-tRNA hydrolase [Magnetospirillum sp.]|nr:aminoacyl-tRNA hydrolase [Magnetospirillum sp.]
MIRITHRISIDEKELEETFVRSSGPGGQNVNKVESAVQLRFDVRNSPSLPDRVKERMVAIAGSRMTQDGVLVIIAQRHRTQERNRADALDRLIDLLRDAAAPPPPVRRPTKPTKGSQQRRLDSKSKHSATKRLRSQRPE